MLNRWKQTTDLVTKSANAPQATYVTSAPPSEAKMLFEGLSTTHLVALWKDLEPIQLSAGEVLFESGSVDHSLFIVLDGLFESDEGEFFSYGQWILGPNFDLEGTHHTCVYAVKSGRILRISRQHLMALSVDVQLFVLRQIQQQQSHRLHMNTVKIRELVHKQYRLEEALLSAKLAERNEFLKGDIVKQVIKRVPKLPVSSAELLNKLIDEKTTRSEVVDLAKNDPTLTSILLKTINSAQFNLSHKVSDVTHAIALLGFESVYQIIMAGSIKQCFPDTLKFNEIYIRSVEISHIAFALSQVTGLGKPAEMATLGLLQDMGLLVIELLTSINPKLGSVFEGMNTHVMGAELLRAWQLPERVSGTIEYQDFPEFAHPERIPDGILQRVALLYVARLAWQVLHQEDIADPLYLKEYLSVVGLKDVRLPSLLKEELLPKLRLRQGSLPASLVSRLNSL
ncbi:HDOD domain-containing protein [Nitrincola nitratireducens]|uniref:HDOD domain protein n=1 Tax=Nitrincola nitratireducens TaxID=1229521 RepID=W9VHX6_9GAMM|nr:HDOD domain-containing protein [Nitrincola nitratireducens]EXJ10210.1 HDOD domain protein [Nitrincola nitratireducens]